MQQQQQQQAEEEVLRVPQTLERLLALDTVLVELIPEKKGLFLKHVEYQVTSQVNYPDEEIWPDSHHEGAFVNAAFIVCLNDE